MKNLLIILDSMDCGGVETYIYSLTKVLKQYCNIFVVSRGGKLVKFLECEQVKHITMNLSNLNQEMIEKNKNKLIDIINENKIDFVNIHPFTIYYPSVWACIESNTPHVLTIHDAIGRRALEYIDDTYLLFLQSVVYKYTDEIIVVSKECKERYLHDFFIEESKFNIVPNSIDGSVFKEINKCNDKINDFLIVSRLDTDKKASVLNSIDLYIYAVDKLNIKNKCSLKIAGIGNEYNEIEQYVKSLQDYNITMLGNVTDVPKIINESDVVMGMGRCILEGMFCKRICILSGYDELKCVVTKDKIFDLSINNFSGRNYNGKSKEQVYDELIETLNGDVNKSLQQCYDIINDKFELNSNSKRIWNIFNNIKQQKQENILALKLINELFLLRNKIVYTKNNNLNFQNEIQLLNKTIDDIYNSKMWKLAMKYYKIRDLFKRKV